MKTKYLPADASWTAGFPGVVLGALFLAFAPCASGQIIFEGDGSDEPGFVDPREKRAPRPPRPPAHISSGESALGGGAPVTPLARSEKKKPPAPPILFTKLTSRYGTVDWATRPRDLHNLLKGMKDMIDVDFRHDIRGLNEIDTDPERNPILYRSGHFRFSFDD